jgi:AraC-like DNA-binding protein
MMTTSETPRVSEPRWEGAALLRPGVLAFSGSIGTTDGHAHHAVQIIIAATALTVVDGAGGRHRGTGLIVPADATHRIETVAEKGCVVFLDPESAAGRAAHRRASGASWTTDQVLADPQPRRPLAAVVADIVESLTPIATAAEPPALHPAVAAAIRLLPTLVGAGTVRGADVAALVGVSASRLTHLFTDQMGITLRRYVLWLRLQAVITRVKAGDDLTDAAHAAGFADSAHLTRTCRDMFGLPPSVMSRHVSWDIDKESSRIIQA